MSADKVREAHDCCPEGCRDDSVEPVVVRGSIPGLPVPCRWKGHAAIDALAQQVEALQAERDVVMAQHENAQTLLGTALAKVEALTKERDEAIQAALGGTCPCCGRSHE